MLTVWVFRQYFIFKDTFKANFQGDKAAAHSSPFILKHTYIYNQYQLSMLATIKKISFISSKWHDSQSH